MLECEKIFEQHFPFWEHLSDEEKSLLCNQTRIGKYEAGEHIHSGENDCIGVLLVKSGHLRAYMLSEDGREITLYRLTDGDICILSASCVLNTITFDVFIDAETDTEIYLINSGTYSQISEQNIYVENFAYQLATERFSDVMWAMQQILFMKIDTRLAIFLNDEIVKTGDTTIKLTHEQIARYIGSAREVVSRMLKYFSDEGIVQLSRGEIKVIDRVKLRDIIK